MVKDSPEAMLLKSIPGVGNYSALVISSMIGDVGRFNSPQNLISYAGLAPSVRSSAGRGTPRAHNQAGRHADEGDTDRVCPDPHSARAKLVRHEGIHQDWTKEGQRKGRSGRGRQDAARRLPDPQGEKRIP